MGKEFSNPYSSEYPEHSLLWQMLMFRDIRAFCSGDWSAVEGDFDSRNFSAVDARGSLDPQDWYLGFANLSEYRHRWLKQSEESLSRRYKRSLELELHEASSLAKIDIRDDVANVLKRFDGSIELVDGSLEKLEWQSLYICRKSAGMWKICGFIGYMPLKGKGKVDPIITSCGKGNEK